MVENFISSALWSASIQPLHGGYPDPAIIAIDPVFKKYCLPLAGVERITLGTRWGEGPVWFGDQRCLIWSDIPNNRMLRFDEQSSLITVFRQSSNGANGNTRDLQGRLITCEHGARRVTRTEYDGTITVILDSFDGKRLNSPNDVVVKSDGSIWFTDPCFGIRSAYDGGCGVSEISANIYRVDPDLRGAEIVADALHGPNGLCFSPDESRLYVVDSAIQPHRQIRVFDVIGNGTRLNNGRLLIDAGLGTPDGIRCDSEGNIWAGWGMGDTELDGVMVFNPEGRPIGRIALPERCANICFGGEHMNRLFMACGHGLYSLYLNATGCYPRAG